MQSTDLPAAAKSFLDDLAYALRDTEEREDVLREVRAHLEDAVINAPPDQQMSAVKNALRELGSVEQISSTATPRRHTGDNVAGRNEAKPRLRLVDTLQIIAATLSLTIGLLIPLLGGMLSVLVFIWAYLGARPPGRRNWAAVILAGTAFVVAAFMFVLQLPFAAAPDQVDLPVTPA